MNDQPLVTKKRVLVVDDDRSIRHMLCRILTDEGYEPSACASGQDGLKQLAEHGADLVLLDLKMPGMSGQDMLAELSARHPQVPVIIMTAFTQSVFGGDFAGASAWLQKPLDFPVLLELINRFAAQSAGRK